MGSRRQIPALTLACCCLLLLALPGVNSLRAETPAIAATIVPADPMQFKAELAGLKGKVVLVNFWATWCRPCLKELPDLMALQAKYRDQGFVLLPVSLDDPSDRETVVRPFLAKWFPELRTLLRMSHDMDAMVSVIDRAWNEVLPTSYVLDRDGKVHARLQGGKDAAAFEAAILPLLNGALANKNIPDKAQAASSVR